MNTRVLKGISTFALTALLLSSCHGTANVPQVPENQPSLPQNSFHLEQLAEGESNPYLAATYSVSSMEALRALAPTNSNTAVFVRGYYENNDGGGGTFYWDATSNAKDNGGTVIQANGVETGRYIRLCEPTYRNVKWFGAVGSGKKDDYKAIQNAIDSLPQSGGTVMLPGGTYAVSQTIQIGNGDGGEKFSTQNAIKLIGQGAGFAVTGDGVPTTIVAAKSMSKLISVNGRISDVLFQDLCISGNNAAQTCLSMTAFSGLTITDVRIQQFSKVGLEIMGGKAPCGNYNIYNRFETLQIVSSMDNTMCMVMDGDFDAINDTWLTTFTDCSFDTASTVNSYGAVFRFVDSCSFYRCQFGGSGEGSYGILFDALGSPSFPCGMGFYDCSVSDIEVKEDETHQIRKQYFYGFCTANGEKIPTHSRLIGITDTGTPFNMDELNIGGKDDPSGLPAKKAPFDTYTAAGYDHRNLVQSQEEIGIHFNAGAKVNGGTFYCPSYDNNVGSLTMTLYRWNENYETSRAGEAVYTVTFENYQDNTWLKFEIENGLEAGEYLLVITATTEEGDWGCGVWTQGATAAVETFVNGELADFGLVGQILIG